MWFYVIARLSKQTGKKNISSFGKYAFEYVIFWFKERIVDMDIAFGLCNNFIFSILSQQRNM